MPKEADVTTDVKDETSPGPGLRVGPAPRLAGGAA